MQKSGLSGDAECSGSRVQCLLLVALYPATLAIMMMSERGLSVKEHALDVE